MKLATTNNTLQELIKRKSDLENTSVDRSLGFDERQKNLEAKQAMIKHLEEQIHDCMQLPAIVSQRASDILQAAKHHLPDEDIATPEMIEFHKTVEKNMYNNLVLLHHAGFSINDFTDHDITHFVSNILYSDRLETCISIINRLSIAKNPCFLSRIQHAVNFGTKMEKSGSAVFFHKDLFEECIYHFGEQELYNIFTYDNIGPTEGHNWVVKNPSSNKSIHDRMQEGAKIIEFCFHMGFDSGMGGGQGFLKVGTFMTPIGNEDKHDVVHYLGSYASEIRYLIEKLQIPFDVLFALEKSEVAVYCGIMRSLHNCTWISQNRHDKYVSFTVGNKPSELDPGDVFSYKTLVHYILEHHSIDKLGAFISFLKTVVRIPLHLPDINHFSNTNIIETMKNYKRIKRPLSLLPSIQKISTDFYIENPETAPLFLTDGRFAEAVVRYDTICSLSYGMSLGQHIAANKDNHIPVWEEYIANIHTLPSFVSNEQEYNRIVGYLQNYRTLLSHTTYKEKYVISNRDEYFSHPDSMRPMLKEMKENLQDISKNMPIILALTKALQLESSGVPFMIPSSNRKDTYEEKHLSPRAFLKQYGKILKRLEHKYAGLYSIGGKIHTEQSISDGKVKSFSDSFGFGQTPFKLIHANTSVLLPPSYFPEELMFMITAMGKYGLFEHQDRPQLQISIPGRLQDEAKAGILASSMILLSQTHVEYEVESFSTTHNSDTARKMVSYDAGVYDPTFKYNSDNINGRTDVLLLRDINLIPKAKVIGSLLGQTEYDGWFASLGMEFIRDYMDLMSRYGLADMITQKPWIFKRDTSEVPQDAHAHYEAVKSFTDRQQMDWFLYNTSHKNQGLLVFELHKLLQIYRKKIESIQSRFR